MKTLATALVATLFALPAAATTVTVTITNNSAADSLYLTPFLNVFHNGDYSAFTGGETASAGLEQIAEIGLTDIETAAVLAADSTRQAVTLTEPTGFGSVPGQPQVFDPGNSATFSLDLDSTDNRYLTLLSMIIPSNDTFITETFELFDDTGAFLGGSFDLGRSKVYDAGTEVNEANGDGQAFNTADGNPPGLLGTDENGRVHLSTDAELATLFGQPIPPLGGFLNSGDLTSFDSLVTVSFELAPVPLPASSMMLLGGIGGLAVWSRRKKKNAA